MRTTDSQSITETKLKRIAWLSERDGHKEFDSLMHHFDETSLEECFYQLSSDKAVGSAIQNCDDRKRLTKAGKGIPFQ